MSIKKFKKMILKPTNLDAIKAMGRGGREAEMELLGHGFHSHNKIHKSDRYIHARRSIREVDKMIGSTTKKRSEYGLANPLRKRSSDSMLS